MKLTYRSGLKWRPFQETVGAHLAHDHLQRLIKISEQWTLLTTLGNGQAHLPACQSRVLGGKFNQADSHQVSIALRLMRQLWLRGDRQDKPNFCGRSTHGALRSKLSFVSVTLFKPCFVIRCYPAQNVAGHETRLPHWNHHIITEQPRIAWQRESQARKN